MTNPAIALGAPAASQQVTRGQLYEEVWREPMLRVAEQHKLVARNNYWTTKKDYATGRMCLQAYSPYRVAKWVNHWREQKPGDLEKKLDAIEASLEDAAGEVENLVAEGERRAEIEREKREQEWRRYEAEEQRRREAKTIAESRHGLLEAITSWGEMRRIQEFFATALAEAESLDPVERAQVVGRIDLARELIGRTDALDALRAWKAPHER